jgi:chromosome segregation ATPase
MTVFVVGSFGEQSAPVAGAAMEAARAEVRRQLQSLANRLTQQVEASSNQIKRLSTLLADEQKRSESLKSTADELKQMLLQKDQMLEKLHAALSESLASRDAALKRVEDDTRKFNELNQKLTAQRHHLQALEGFVAEATAARKLAEAQLTTALETLAAHQTASTK